MPDQKLRDREVAAAFLAVKAEIDRNVHGIQRAMIKDEFIQSLVEVAVKAIDDVRDQSPTKGT